MKIVIPTVRGFRTSVEINVRATVYSFQALMNTKIRAVTIPGAATGRRIRIRAETFPQPSTVAACSISGEMEIKVPRSSQIANAWLNAALINTSPTRLSVMPKVDMIL